MATIWDRYYKGMKLEQIKVINPFANETYLNDGEDLSPGREKDIEELFDGHDTVSTERIKKRNQDLGQNYGSYAAFRAITHGLAEHDEKRGIIKANKRKNLQAVSISRLTDKTAILKAVEEFDKLGRDPFLSKYGYGHATDYYLFLNNKHYDSKAIVGVAYGYQHPEHGPLSYDDFSGGISTVVKKLEKLGFQVKKPKQGKSWEEDEVNLIVEDYFSMFRKELSDKAYNKTEYRNKLIGKLNFRTEGAIELKHQNISGVLTDIGLPFIDGYKPRSNYQQILKKSVENYLERNDDFLNILDIAVNKSPDKSITIEDNFNNILVKAPPLINEKNETSDKDKNFTPRKYNFSEREAKNKVLGKKGEEFALNWERTRLCNEGREDLSKQVEWVSQTQGDGAGYDIASFETNGNPRHIEVKTTNQGKNSRFLISRNEVLFANANIESFYIYRVFNFSKAPKMYILNGINSDQCRLSPTMFEVSFK